MEWSNLRYVCPSFKFLDLINPLCVPEWSVCIHIAFAYMGISQSEMAQLMNSVYCHPNSKPHQDQDEVSCPEFCKPDLEPGKKQIQQQTCSEICRQHTEFQEHLNRKNCSDVLPGENSKNDVIKHGNMRCFVDDSIPKCSSCFTCISQHYLPQREDLQLEIGKFCLSKITITILSAKHLNNLAIPPFSSHPIYPKVLILDHCMIKIIENEAFQSLKALLTLNLNCNLITDLLPGSLNGLRNLHVLYLSNNYLRIIKLHTFKDLQFLIFIYLDFNNISHIEEKTFHHTKRLKILSLKGNKMIEFGWEVYHNLKTLRVEDTISKHFDIKNQAISEIDSLFLGDNSFSCLSDEVFRYLFHLIKLDLSFNYISDISQRTFSDQIA